MDIKLSDIIKNQAIINFGTAGHVAHGKSTVVKRITGVSTQAYKAEQERNITIRLGYANCKFYRNPRTNRVFALPEDKTSAFDPETDEELELLYQVSFVDCPGHQAYISTMISGSYIMDYVLVVVAANCPIPQPQTHEHLLALDYSGIQRENMCYLLNKMDIVSQRKAGEVKGVLSDYLSTTFEDRDPTIIPISAANGDNIDSVISHLAEKVSNRLERTIKQSAGPLRMYTVRSYNINRPNAGLELEGAVVGGTIISGTISVGDYVEIRPGVINMRDGKKVVQPLVSRVTGLKSGRNSMDVAIPGGLVGVNLSLYAGLSGDDMLKGQVVTHVGFGDPICNQLAGKFKSASALSSEASSRLQGLHAGSVVSVVVDGIMNVKATVISIKGKEKGRAELSLGSPVVLRPDSCVAIQVDGHLVAGMRVDSSSCTLPICYELGSDIAGWKPTVRNIINDLKAHKSEPLDFDDMCKRIGHIGKTVKLAIVPPTLDCVNMSTYISGMGEFIGSIVAPGHPSGPGAISEMELLFIEELGKLLHESKPRYNKDGTLLLDGRWNSKQLNSSIKTFIAKYLRCPNCGSDASHIIRQKVIKRRCTVCERGT